MDNSMIINPSNASTFKQVQYKKIIFSHSNHWHKFVIEGGAELDREKLLKVIVDCAGELFPIQYQISGKDASFIARNCPVAVDNLCSRNLVLEYQPGQTVNLSILLGQGCPSETTLKIQDVIMQVLNRRFNKKTGILNLENLVKDSFLSDKVYCALSHQKILTFVLSLTRSMDVKYLRLSNNEIKDIAGLEVVGTNKSLISIDLRNNLIERMVKLVPLKNMRVTELWLEGNPVCQNYEENGYVAAIKEICPNIEKLDGIVVGSHGAPAYRRNYLINIEAQELIDQFLEHYFNLYDSKDRRCFQDLYHKNALFSLTTLFLAGQSTSYSARLEIYKKIGRNILTMSDYSKHDKSLIIGSDQIIKTLCSLPLTEHDPFTFTVDLLYYNGSTVVLTVTGVFREHFEKLGSPERLLGFMKTFVLKEASNDNRFEIINELTHIYNASTAQAQRSFKKVLVPNSNLNPLMYTNEDKTCLIETYARITTLNMENARKYLETNNWNMKTALTEFVEKYKDGRISAEAFKIT